MTVEDGFASKVDSTVFVLFVSFVDRSYAAQKTGPRITRNTRNNTKHPVVRRLRRSRRGSGAAPSAHQVAKPRLSDSSLMPMAASGSNHDVGDLICEVRQTKDAAAFKICESNNGELLFRQQPKIGGEPSLNTSMRNRQLISRTSGSLRTSADVPTISVTRFLAVARLLVGSHQLQRFRFE